MSEVIIPTQNIKHLLAAMHDDANSARTTKIQWTHHTFNPWWGCEKVSPACQYCYAHSMAKRVGRDVWGRDAERFLPSDSNWAKVRKLDKKANLAGVRQRIFCASMADVFEDRRDLDAKRTDVWKLINSTTNLDWQLLTKRPQHIAQMVPVEWLAAWPSHVWIGCTVENQEFAEKRLPYLVQLPAPVRFVSCEPLLGPLDLEPWLANLHWVITGGESGAKRRLSDPQWFHSLRDQCKARDVPFFFKQWGGLWSSQNGSLLDGREWKAFPSNIL